MVSIKDVYDMLVETHKFIESKTNAPGHFKKCAKALQRAIRPVIHTLRGLEEELNGNQFLRQEFTEALRDAEDELQDARKILDKVDKMNSKSRLGRFVMILKSEKYIGRLKDIHESIVGISESLKGFPESQRIIEFGRNNTQLNTSYEGMDEDMLKMEKYQKNAEKITKELIGRAKERKVDYGNIGSFYDDCIRSNTKYQSIIGDTDNNSEQRDCSSEDLESLIKETDLGFKDAKFVSDFFTAIIESKRTAEERNQRPLLDLDPEPEAEVPEAEVPDHLQDPFYKTLMEDPVFVPVFDDTYDRSSLEKYLRMQDIKHKGGFVQHPENRSKIKFPIKYQANLERRRKIEDFYNNHPEHRPRREIQYTDGEQVVVYKSMFDNNPRRSASSAQMTCPWSDQMASEGALASQLAHSMTFSAVLGFRISRTMAKRVYIYTSVYKPDGFDEQALEFLCCKYAYLHHCTFDESSMSNLVYYNDVPAPSTRNQMIRYIGIMDGDRPTNNSAETIRAVIELQSLVSDNKENCLLFESLGGLKRLINFLGHRNHFLREHTALTIYKIVKCARSIAETIVSMRAVEQLLDSMQKAGHPAAQYNTIKVVWWLIAEVPQAKNDLGLQGVDVLLTMLAERDSTTQWYAAGAIWALVNYDGDMCRTVYNRNGIAYIVRLLEMRPIAEAEQSILQILWNLFEYCPGSAASFQTQNGQPYLEALVRNPDPKTRDVATEVLKLSRRTPGRSPSSSPLYQYIPIPPQPAINLIHPPSSPQSMNYRVQTPPPDWNPPGNGSYGRFPRM